MAVFVGMKTVHQSSLLFGKLKYGFRGVTRQHVFFVNVNFGTQPFAFSAE